MRVNENLWYDYQELINFLNDPRKHISIGDKVMREAESGRSGPSEGAHFTQADLSGIYNPENYEKGLQKAHRELLKCVDLIFHYRDNPKKLKIKLRNKIDSALQCGDFLVSVTTNGPPWFTIDPDFGNYFVVLLSMIKKKGIRSLLRCDKCNRLALARRPRQRFCRKKCRYDFHNAQKAPRMKEYMRKWREENPGMG